MVQLENQVKDITASGFSEKYSIFDTIATEF